MGYTYSELHQVSRAIEDFNETIRLQPDFPYIYIHRGLAFFIQGNNELGCSDAQKGCELGICKILEIAKARGDCS